MPDPKGSRLFVNLGPSQARRRLKGFGHGMRKVQSAGRNQAVIIHTATGRHLHALESKFADVGFSGTENDLSELPPKGRTTARSTRTSACPTISRLRLYEFVDKALKVKR